MTNNMYGDKVYGNYNVIGNGDKYLASITKCKYFIC